MNQDGFARFATVENLALRARVTVEEAKLAEQAFLSPDPNSSNPSNEGRRIEKVPGGYVILNAQAYRAIATHIQQRDQNRERVARHRAHNQGKRKKRITSHYTSLTPVCVCASESASDFKQGDSKGDGEDCYEQRYPDGVRAVAEDLVCHLHARTAIHWLNQEGGRKYREVREHLEIISKRLHEPGIDIEGVKLMISRQAKLWKGTPRGEFLRPSTLFGEKFDSYYAARLEPATQTGNYPKSPEQNQRIENISMKRI